MPISPQKNEGKLGGRSPDRAVKTRVSRGRKPDSMLDSSNNTSHDTDRGFDTWRLATVLLEYAYEL